MKIDLDILKWPVTQKEAETILKFLFATDEQLAEREALKTREQRKAYWDSIPTPQLKNRKK